MIFKLKVQWNLIERLHVYRLKNGQGFLDSCIKLISRNSFNVLIKIAKKKDVHSNDDSSKEITL